MKWLCISFVFLILVLPYGHGYRSSREEDNSSEQLSTLGKKVKVLTNELKALKEDVKELKGENGSSEPEPDFLPLEASRKIRPDGKVRFTLKYRAKPTILAQVRVFWIDTDDYAPIQESISNVIPRLPPNVYETSVEIDASNTTHVSVSAGTMTFWYRLNIRNSLEGNAIQLLTSFPEGHVTPADDIVYELGTNASIQVTGPLEERSPSNPGFDGAGNMDLQFYINPPGSNDILEKYGDENVLEHFFEPEEAKPFFDKMEATIVFNTSVVAYSGLVMIMLGQSYPDDLVYRIEKNYMLKLHPSTQSGPFREGLLAPREMFWLKTNANGDRVEHCRPGELCRVYCQVFGNDLNQVEMLKTVHGVAETINPSHHEEGEFFAYAMDTFYMTADPNPINYTCVGSDAGGRRVVNTYMLYLRDPPTFVENQTSIEVTEEQEVNVTCTATGSPLPQVNITISVPGITESNYSEDDLEVLYQTNDTISVSKVVKLNGITPDMYQDWVFTSFASCQAFNTGGENTKYLYNNDEIGITSYYV